MLAGPLPADVTIDAFLGGRFEAVQPARGHHRAGLDAILLAAAIDHAAVGRIADLGAGAGIAGLAVATRVPGSDIVLVEREAELVACAEAALSRPANAGAAARIRIAAIDLFSAEATRIAAGLAPDSFDHAIMNPPFHDEASVRMSPAGHRARAHVLAAGGLDGWFRVAAGLVRPRGTLTAIFPAGGLAALLSAAEGRFGGLTLLPIHARAGEPALRLILRGVKGSRAPLRLLPGLVLHDATGSGFRPDVAAILRDGADLADAVPSWRATHQSSRSGQSRLLPIPS